MSEKPKTDFSLAESVRLHIRKQLDNKVDLSSATLRKQDILFFIADHKKKFPKHNLDFNAVRSTYTPQYDKVVNAKAIDEGIDPKLTERKKPNKSKLKFNPDINAKITPSPQSGQLDSSKSNQPQPQGAQQIFQSYSVESVSATFGALFLTLKVAFPHLEELSSDEKKAIGEMWQPAFNLYLQNEKLAVIGIPLLSTIGLFLPKILASRKKSKILKSANEANLRQKEIDTKTQPITPTQTPDLTASNIPSVGEAKTDLTFPKDTKSSKEGFQN